MTCVGAYEHLLGVGDRGDLERERGLLGVRFLAHLIGSARLIAALVVAGTVFGAIGGAVAPGPFTIRGSIQVGKLYPKNPIERPVVAARRLEAAGQVVADARGDGTIEAHTRKGRQHPRVGAIIDITVRAKTASTAAMILDSAFAETLAAHEKLRAFDEVINLSHQDSTARRARVMLENVTSTAATDVDLVPALLRARKDQAVMANLQMQFKAPPSRVVRRDPKASRGTARWKLFGLTGALIGGLLSLVLLMVNASLEVARKEAEAPDAVFGDILMFLATNRKIVVGVAVAVALIGAIGALVRPTTHTGRMTIQSARVAPDAPFEHVSVTRLRLESYIASNSDEVCGERCGVTFSVVPVRSQLNDSQHTDVVELRATGAGRASITRVLDAGFAEYMRGQQDEYERATGVWEKKIATLQSDIDRLEASDVLVVNQMSLINIIREQGATRRYLNPARSYSARVLSPTRITRNPKARNALLLAFLGMVAGTVLGSAIALTSAAMRLSKSQVSKSR